MSRILLLKKLLRPKATNPHLRLPSLEVQSETLNQQTFRVHLGMHAYQRHHWLDALKHVNAYYIHIKCLKVNSNKYLKYSHRKGNEVTNYKVVKHICN